MATGVAAGAAIWLHGATTSSRTEAMAAGASGGTGAVYEETVDDEFALDAIRDADPASFDR